MHGLYVFLFLGYNHTERQAACQVSTSAAAAASPMQVYGDASLDAPNGSQTHCINLTLDLPLTLDVRCGYSFRILSCYFR